MITGTRARQSCWNSKHYGPSLQGSSHHLLALQMCVDIISIISTYLHNLARPRDLYCGLNISCAAAGHIKVRLGTAACSMQLAAHCRLQAAPLLLPSSCFLLDTDYIIPPLCPLLTTGWPPPFQYLLNWPSALSLQSSIANLVQTFGVFSNKKERLLLEVSPGPETSIQNSSTVVIVLWMVLQWL